MPFEIAMLGEFSIRSGDDRIDIQGINRLPALIACLALHRDAPVPRSEVAFKLWPESSEAQAHTNLRKTLHYVRQKFPGKGLLHVDGHRLQLRLSPQDRLDLDDFETALHSADGESRAGNEEAACAALETACALYKGDLLPRCDDDWLVGDRQHFRDLFLGAAARLIERLEARREYRDAIQHAQRLLQLDNLCEENYRRLIRLHALNDDRAAALSVYHTCASTLAKELAVEPDGSTRQLYERLLHTDSVAFRAPASAVPPLVGRAGEWDCLTSAWRRAGAGGLRLVLLSGEAGIGKTRLAEDFLHWAQQQGIRTAFAACYPGERQSSYAAVAVWLRALSLDTVDQRWRPELSRILPELQGTAPPPITENWQKQAFHEAMARAVLGGCEPDLIALDDIHWCDADMLEWLRYLIHLDPSAKGFLLGTLRPEELPSNHNLESMLTDLRAEDRLTEIDLGRLNREQTNLLGAHLLGRQLDPSASSFLFTASEGVPLFVVELARAGTLEDEARKPVAQREQRDSLPPRLRAVVEGRLGHLAARAVLEAAAVLGREFSPDLLRRVSELDESTTIGALDDLWRRRLVRERRGGVYDFSHDKLREVTLLSIGPVRTRWLHQRAAQALEGLSPSEALSRIADHYERADMDPQAARYYAAAARRERGLFALNDALEHFTRALLFETDPAALASLHEERGDVLNLLEQRDEAYRAFEQALGLAQGHVQRARLAHKQITVSSRFEPATAHQCYLRALHELNLARGESGYWTEWIQTKFAWMEACYWQQDPAALRSLLKEARAPVARHGTLLQKIHFRHQIISAVFLRKRYLFSLKDAAYAAESAEMARRAGSPYLLATAVEAAALAAYCANDMDAAQSSLRELIQLSEKFGDDNTLRIGHAYLSLTMRRLRRSKVVRVETEQLATELKRGSPNAAYQGVVESNYAWLAYQDGDFDAAKRHARSALEEWSQSQNPYPMQWCALIVLFATAVDAGDNREALGILQAMLTPPQQRLLHDVEAAFRLVLLPGVTGGKAASSRLKAALASARTAAYI